MIGFSAVPVMRITAVSAGSSRVAVRSRRIVSGVLPRWTTPFSPRVKRWPAKS